MQGIEFEQETYHPLSVPVVSKKKSLLIRMVYKVSGGKIHTDAQASFALLVIAIIFASLTIYNMFFYHRDRTPEPLTPADIQRMHQSLEGNTR